MTRNIVLILLLVGVSLLPLVSGCLSGFFQGEATYVGAAKCRECHAEVYDGWKTTLHPYKFQRVSPDTVVGDFSKNNRMVIDGKTTTMSEKDREYFVTTTGPDSKEHTYKVGYVIGGFWKQLYVCCIRSCLLLPRSCGRR